MIIVLGGAGYFGYQKIRGARAQQEYEDAFNSYIDTLETVQYLMLGSGAKAETLSNLTVKVWSGAIYTEFDSETRKYIIGSEGDFNIALAKLYSDPEIEKTVEILETEQELVGEHMKELQNPPEGLEICYTTVTNLYTSYNGFVELAVNPTGSLSTFSDERFDKAETFMAEYHKLETQIPERFPVEEELKENE